MTKTEEAFLEMLPEGTRFSCLVCSNTIKPSNYSEHKKICSKSKKNLVAIRDENVRESHETTGLIRGQTIGLPSKKLPKKNKADAQANTKGTVADTSAPQAKEPKPDKLVKGQYLISEIKTGFSWKWKAKYAVLTASDGKKFLSFGKNVAGPLASLNEELTAMLGTSKVMALDIDGDETTVKDRETGEQKTIQYIFIKRITIGETVYRLEKTYINGNEAYVLQVAQRDTEALREKLHPTPQESTVKPEMLAQPQVAESKPPVS